MTTDLTMPVAIAATVPILLLRIGVVYVRLKMKRRGAVRAFRKALLRGGVGREAADRLAAEFEAYGRLRSYFPGDRKLRLRPLRR